MMVHKEIEATETPSPRLLMRPRPIKGESTRGFILRVSSANGFERPRQLNNALGSFEALCDALQISASEVGMLIGPLPHYWGRNTLPEGLVAADFNHFRMRWCSLCLQESEHLRSQWMLKLCCVCTVHGIYLHERCSSCGLPQSLERSSLTFCECGGILSAAAVQQAPYFLVKITVAFEEAVFGHMSNTGLPKLSASEWIRLIKYLGRFSEESHPAKPGQVANMHHLDVATGLMHGTAQLLENWPKNFHAILRSIQQKQTASTSLRRDFAPIYYVLYSRLKAESFLFLRDAFEAYIHENWWGLVCKRHRSFSQETVKHHPRLTIKEAAKQAGVNPSTARHMVQAELIQSVKKKLPSGREARSLHRFDIEQIRALAKGAMTLKEAASSLALPKRRVRELVDADILKPIISRKSSSAASWLFSEEELAKLCGFSGSEASNAKLVVFKQILKSWRLREGEFVSLVKAFVDGDLRPATSHTSGIGEAMFDVALMRTWLYKHRILNGGMLSVDEAARYLGIKQQVAYELVARGLLLATPHTGMKRVISAKQLTQFQEKYVSLAELARKKNISPKLLLGKVGVVPVCGPSVDGLRQYFFLRSDISEIQLWRAQ